MLPDMEVDARLPRLRALLADAEVDALVVTNLVNIRYLTGFTGSAGMLVVREDAAVLMTDGRYTIQAAEQLEGSGARADLETIGATNQAEVARAQVPEGARLGLEAAHVSWARQRAFDSEWFPAWDLVPTVGLVEQLRRVKDAGEQARLLAAASIADRAFATVRPMLEEGPTEAAFALALDDEMRRLGASEPSFDTIVASGPNSAKPHHRPSARVVRKGEPVVVDFGARFEGYCSDMTRTVSAGPLGDEQMRRVRAVVAASQAAGVAAVRAGVAGSEVDRVCRAVIEEAGWGEEFVHSTGHGVGLDIHEAPTVAATSKDTLEVGQVVTVEPGVYLRGLGGVRIEDTVTVTATGCTVLTTATKES